MQNQTQTLTSGPKRPTPRHLSAKATDATLAFMGFSQRELRQMVAAMMG